MKVHRGSVGLEDSCSCGCVNMFAYFSRITKSDEKLCGRMHIIFYISFVTKMQDLFCKLLQLMLILNVVYTSNQIMAVGVRCYICAKCCEVKWNVAWSGELYVQWRLLITRTVSDEWVQMCNSVRVACMRNRYCVRCGGERKRDTEWDEWSCS
jgi:hypothetical protein